MSNPNSALFEGRIRILRAVSKSSFSLGSDPNPDPGCLHPAPQPWLEGRVLKVVTSANITIVKVVQPLLASE